MRAIVIDRYGTPDVLRLEDVEKPAPAEGEALVGVRASSVNPYDWHILTGLPKLFRPTFGFRRPKFPILGADFAGIVESIGAGVTGVAPGDEVFGQTSAGCFAEFAAIKARNVALKPAGLSFEEAASIPLAGFTALQGLRDKGGVEPGQQVLINGASGGVGTLAVQIATAMGGEVTGVCSTRNVELVRSLGAAHVIDYTRDDFTEGPRRYDLILDLVGNRPLRKYRRTLERKGIYLASHGQPENLWLGPLLSMMRAALWSPLVGQKLTAFIAKVDPDDLAHLAGLLEAGAIKPVVDRTFPLEEVPEAFRYLEQWHARGKVVITV